MACHLIRTILTAAIALAATGCSERPPDAATAPESPAAEPDPSRAPVVLEESLGPFYRLIVDRDTGAARVRLRKHLNKNPDDGQAEFLFGLSYHREKRYALARSWFEDAIEHAPDYPPSHYFLGWTRYYLGEPEAARAAFETHLRWAPDEGDTHFGLGLVDLDEDHLDDAERRFRRAIALQTDLPARTKELSKSHALLADVLVRRGDYEGAKTELSTATKLHPDHYAAFYRLYRVHLRRDEAEAAEAARREFIASRRRAYPGTRFPE